jgi:hypothetical protein
VSILEDEGIRKSDLVETPPMRQLLSAIEVWIGQESSGKDAAEELDEVRMLALRMGMGRT